MGILENKRVLVTGATSGLGYAMAEALLKAGARVAIAARPTHRLGNVVGNWQALGLLAEALPLDVRQEDSVLRARDAFGHCDLVVNNAGLGMRTVNAQFMTNPEPFFKVTPAQFDAVLETNLRGYFMVARAFSERFIAQGSGAFVNITMNHETMVRQGFVPYGPSRAGAESLSLIMVEDLKPFGITVNMLLPGGATATGMIPESVGATVRESLIQPEIMGPPIVFLASDRASGMTGERIIATKWRAWCEEHGIAAGEEG